MENAEQEKIEIDLLLEAIYRQYGYDFREYSKASIRRRVRHFLDMSGLSSMSEMIHKTLYEESFFQSLVSYFSITVTEMFRDPTFYRAVREKVVPFLKTYPYVKIWHAGCATGEEVYSLAIVLQEEGFYDRATIFATDFNDISLKAAKEAVYPIGQVKQYTENYQNSGGVNPFSDYYHARYDSIILDKQLKKNITFANHNLVTDGVFGEMNLVLCRNVLIYFNKDLQDRVLTLFGDSLVHNGFLCLGSKESIKFSTVCNDFRVVDEREKIFQKKG